MSENMQTDAFKDLYNNTEAFEENKTLQKIVKEVQELTDYADDGGKNDRIDISQFLGKNFENNLKSITTEQAQTLIGELNAIKKNDKLHYDEITQKEIDELIALLSPIAHTITGTEKMAESTSTSKEATNLNGNLRKEANKLYNESIKIRKKIPGNHPILHNYTIIQNILEFSSKNKSISYKNLDKLHVFLEANIKDEDTKKNLNMRSKDNPEPIFNGISQYLKEIDARVDAEKNSNSVKEKYSEEYSKKVESFNKLINIVPTNLSKLHKLSDKDIDNIKYIVDHPEQLEKNERIYMLYIIMNKYNKPLDEKDKTPFNEIKNYIWDKQKENIQQYDLETVFGNIGTKTLKDIAPNGWKGENLKGNEEKFKNFITNKCTGHVFDESQFIKKFDTINESRKEENEDALKSAIKMNSLINTDLLNKITLEQDGEQPKLTYQNENSEPVVLTATNFINTLKLSIDSSQIPFLGNEKNDAIQSLQDDRYGELVELRKKYTPTETQNEKPKLEEINAKDIKNCRGGLNKNNIAIFFNTKIKQEGLNESQKELLLLAQKGLKGESINNDILALQQKFFFSGDDLDGKFGPKTYIALDHALKTTNTQPINIKGSPKSPETGKIYTIDERIDKKLKPYEGTDLTSIKSKLGISNTTPLYKREKHNGYYYKQDNKIIYIPTPPSFYIQTLSKFPDNEKKESRTKEYPTNCEYFKNGLTNIMNEIPNKDNKISLGYKPEIRYYGKYFWLGTYSYEQAISLETLTSGRIREKKDYNNDFKQSLQEDLKLLNLCNYVASLNSANGPFTFDQYGENLLSNNTKIENVLKFDNITYRKLNEKQQNKFLSYLTGIINHIK